ncbi:MAG: diaminopropionate ammonia-lyase [Peptococcaceae bacterium]|nr:diaminopropionate ammonia-lyase [Peptococcaceae bacterium]
MGASIQWTTNNMRRSVETGYSTELFGLSEIAKARNFHASFPQYQPTPLRSLKHLAKILGVGGIYVKDESYRFGLNAFKALGGSYAIARLLAQRLHQDVAEMPYQVLTSDSVKQQLGEITFATTTDGNHGRGVAWTARQLGQRAIIYMPKGSSLQRLENIRAEGAEAYITDLNYDDAVRMTAAKAKANGWLVVQDTAWEGYEEIPTWIMQGYGTMSAEALEQLNKIGIAKPTHIFTQAGVGALAGSVEGYFTAIFGQDRPKMAVVEADQANCLLKSIQAGDGKPRAVGGELTTIMAGLACGEPNIISWDILRDYCEMFISCPDWVAAKGMRILGSPLQGDPKVVSGESGAVTVGLLWNLLRDDGLQKAREALGLNEQSQILLFNTEGDTDPEAYLNIVWDGCFASAAR